MIIKMLITFDYNPDTNEFTPIKKELVKDETPKKATVKPQVEESGDPQVTLESNKYILNQAAATLMGVEWEDRISVKYQKVDGLLFPVIGKDEAFGTGGGNKVTKSLTVSCRGNANEKLSKYGNVFTVTKLKDKAGLFVLVGNAERPEETEQDEVKVPVEIDVDNIDLPLDASIGSEQGDTFEITEDTFEI